MEYVTIISETRTYDLMTFMEKAWQQARLNYFQISPDRETYRFESGDGDAWGSPEYYGPEEVKVIAILPADETDDGEWDWDGDNFEITLQAPNGEERTFEATRADVGMFL